MQKRTRFTIQEIIDELRMTSTTTRYPVKAKSLTLLELCQTINELRQTTSRNTAQILTRRLYLHPLTISTNAKQHSSRIIANNLIEIEEHNQTILEKKTSAFTRQPYRGLSVLSSSVPLTTRTSTKLNSSLDSNSTTTVNLPPIKRGISSSSSKRTISTHSSSCIPIRPKPHHNRWEKIDAWRNLTRSLQRPIPKDPPTTPLDFQPTEQENFHAIQQIQIYKRKVACDITIDENISSEDDD